MYPNNTIKKYDNRGQVWEIFKVVQWKEGCIYRTRSLGYVVCSSSALCVNEKGTLSAVSSKVTRKWMGI